MQKPYVLLHCCCANCGAACIERLRSEGYGVALFYANSNIAPEAEFWKRHGDVVSLAERMCTRLYVDPYDHDAWLATVRGLEDAPEKGPRCAKCFAFNLRRAADKAAELSMPHFTTTLTVSPHKVSSVIFEIGSTYDRFLPVNFKKKDGFKRSLELSREFDFYRQDYCGCEFSQ